MNEIKDISIEELHFLLKSAKISSREATLACLKQIETTDDILKAFITVDAESALKQADMADERIGKRDEMPFLCGVPIALKDNICSLHMRTTCGSRMLENFIPAYDSTVSYKLKKDSAVIIGKTNMDEFGMGSSTEYSAFFATRNPWDIQRVPGGSSGGSAAAVSAGLVFGALGSDTGWSIRQPASFCSLVGVKPTYGLVSRYGLVAYASSLDQIGPLARTARDSAIILNSIKGHDRRDSTSLNTDHPDYLRDIDKEIKNLRIGIYNDFINENVESAVTETFNNTIEIYKKLGARIVNVDLSGTKSALSAYYVIAPSEASSNLSRFDGSRYGLRFKEADNVREMFRKTRGMGFGSEVKRRILVGTYALSSGYYDAYYLKSQKIRTIIIDSFKNALKDCDLILMPTSPVLPFKIGDNVNDPVKMYLSDMFSVTANLTGFPAVSFPAGFKNGLPVGMQMIGLPLNEKLLLNAVNIFERETGYTKIRPRSVNS